MNNPEQVRQKIKFHTGRLRAERYQTPESTTWEVIHDMENAWRSLPVKQRVANRRSILLFLFGVDSTKQLDAAEIGALLKWMRHSPDREAELHAVLKAALVRAGQVELAI